MTSSISSEAFEKKTKAKEWKIIQKHIDAHILDESV